MTSSSFHRSDYGGSSSELNASATTQSVGGPMLLCLIEVFS